MKKMFEDANEYVDLEKNVFLYFDKKLLAVFFNIWRHLGTFGDI